jgi:hypothetical protein
MLTGCASVCGASPSWTNPTDAPCRWVVRDSRVFFEIASLNLDMITV